MTADRRHCVDGRGSAPSRHGAAAAGLAVRVVVRGHVETAAEVSRDRLAEPWTITALAEEVHLSRSQLGRAFDAIVGTSPTAYLRQMRLRQMSRLLTLTDLFLPRRSA